MNKLTIQDKQDVSDQEARQSFTPGPWRIEPTSMKGQFLVSGGDIRGGDGFSLQFREANARLISAAPDLLAIAERVVTLFHGTDSPLGNDAAAAIAKATLSRDV